MLVLHGLNLEIADAANRAGFNTRNQVALMDLIWAVRRIGFRHAVKDPEIRRPPKHPVYPDHYRPGDPSDNTKKKRKRRRGQDAHNPSSGTADNPIYLDEDIEAARNEATALSSAKRQKVKVGQMGSHKVTLPERSRPLNPVHPTKFQTSSIGRQDRGRPRVNKTIYMPSPRSLNLPPPRPSSVAPIFKNLRPLIEQSRDNTILQLQKVGNTFRDNIDAVMECGNVMKTLYNGDNRLADNVVYKELEALKAKFDGCVSDAEAGMGTVQRIIALLDEKKENVAGLVGS